MKHLIFFVFLFISLFLNFGCSNNQEDKNNKANDLENENADDKDEVIRKPEKMSPRNYVAWVEDKNNGIKVEKNIEDFTYAFQFKPLEYVSIMDIKKDTIKTVELKNKIEEYKGLQYFTFRISTESRTELLKKNLTETNDYYGRIQYFSFDMQKDLKLIDGKDTLDCVLFHFERVYGIAPYATFVLGFPNSKQINDKTLFYDEKVFGAGRIYLTIRSKNIKRLPEVITY